MEFAKTGPESPLEQQIGRIAAAFEAAWRSNSRPSLASHLAASDAALREALFSQLLVIDLTSRRQAGESPQPGEYVAQFPEFTARIESVFATLASPTAPTAGESESLETLVPTPSVDKTEPLQPPIALGARHGEKDSEPEAFGRYRVTGVLGSGAFGRVYLAYDAELERHVAVKAPRPDRLHNEYLRNRFLSEARRVAKLDHRHLVKVHDVGCTAEGVCYVVMEHVEGGTLKGKLIARNLEMPEIVRTLAEVAEGAAYAHRYGLIHRDIKPENILLDAEGHARIADFGLALHETEQHGHCGEISGTLPYMSPEQVRGWVRGMDGRTDIWAIGVIFYESLTFRRPFDGRTSQEIQEAILHREPKPPRQIDKRIPPEHERICLKCLAKSPTDRYTTAEDIAADLRRSLVLPATPQGSPDMVAHSGGPGLLRNDMRPTPHRLKALSGGAVVLVALAFGWTLWGKRDETRNSPPILTQAATTSSGRLDIGIWRKVEDSSKKFLLREFGALPLRQGDQLRIDVSLAKPAYPYLVWVDAEGKASPIYPWRPGDWNARPSHEDAVRNVSLPQKLGEGWPLEGPEGMETILLLVRNTPLPRNIDLEDLFSDLPRQATQGSKALIEFVDGRPLAKDAEARAPNFSAPSEIDDSLLRTQATLAKRLVEHFDHFTAMSFAHTSASQGGP